MSRQGSSTVTGSRETSLWEALSPFWSHSTSCGGARQTVLPNKRLKLPGGDRLKGSGVLCAGAHELSFNYRCAGGRVARSLSAIR